MMDITKCAAKALGLLVLPLAATFGAQASDELVADMPSPFSPVCVKTERIGAAWRHNFHKMRTTWDKYFEVYPDELADYQATTLEKVKENPAFYLDRNIQFEIHYAKTGAFYRPFVSPFHEDGYINFSVWPYGTDLWNKDVRSDVSPLFYIDKQRDKLIQKFDHLPMFTPVHVWATVRSKSDNMPWVEVKGAELIRETTLRDTTLRHLEAGAAQMRQKRYDLAAQMFASAISEQLPLFAEARAYSLLGRAEYEQRLYRGARNALVNAIVRNPDVVANLVLLARTDLRVDPEDGNFAAEAKEAALKAIELEPTNPEAHAELGLALAMLGDVRGGYQELDYAQKFAPRGQLPEANRNRAMIAILEKNLELAKQELNQAVILRATDYTLHLELGDVHLAMGHLEDARREYTQAKELAPNRAEPLYKTALAMKLMADALDKDGKKEDATKLYNEALENVKSALAKDVHLTKAYGLEAEILRKLGRDDDAKKVLEQGASLNPNNPHMNDIYYQIAAADNDWAGMEKATRASLNLKGDALHYSRLGKILALRPAPDLAGAAEALSKAISMNPGSGDDLALLGHVRLLTGDPTGAAQALNEAVKIQTNNGAAFIELAQADRATGDRAGALAAADRAAAILGSTDAKLLAAQTRIDRAEGNDLAEAIEMAQGIETATKVDAEKSAAQLVRATALVKQSKLDEATELMTALEAGMKDNADYDLAAGRLALARGDVAGAREKLNAALEISRKDANTRVQAEALRALAEVDTATQKGVVVIHNNTETKTTDGGEATNKRPMPPVTEEGNGSSEPVPAQVPGPR
jgi:tetratricopeptide (TPR) repeat protein